MTAADIHRIAMALPRTRDGIVRDSVRYYIGRIVYVALSPDDTIMGFAYPKDGRASLVASQPEKFRLPRQSDLRYNWVDVVLDAIDEDEAIALIEDAWTMVVPKSVAAEYFRRAD